MNINNINNNKKKNYFSYDNKVIEHFNSSNIGIYFGICCVILLLIMFLVASTSNLGFFQSLVRLESITYLFEILGSLASSIQTGGIKNYFSNGE